MAEPFEVPFRVQYDDECRHLTALREAEGGVDWEVTDVEPVLTWLVAARKKPDLAAALRRYGCRFAALGRSKLGDFAVVAFLGMSTGLRRKAEGGYQELLPNPKTYGADLLLQLDFAVHVCKSADLAGIEKGGSGR